MTHHDEVHHCDLHCGRPAPHTWICWDCHTQLTTALDSFTPDDLAHLQQIARREATPATRPTAHTTHQYGPAVPLHLGALTAHHAITTRFDDTVDGLPHDPDAAHHHRRHTNTLRYARELLEGEPRPIFTPDQVEYIRSLPPMSAADVCAWLKTHTGARIRPGTVRVWAHRGKIPKHPGGYLPGDVLGVWTQTT